MNTFTLADAIRDTAQTHGVAWTAKHYARNRVNIDVVLHALGFNRVGVAK